MSKTRRTWSSTRRSGSKRWTAASATLLMLAALSGCQLIAGLTERTSGTQSCIHNSDCRLGHVCIFETCAQECEADIDCPRASRCLDVDGASACVSRNEAACTDNKDCPAATICSTQTCRTLCGGVENSQCREDQTCVEVEPTQSTVAPALHTCIGNNSAHDAGSGTGGDAGGYAGSNSGGPGGGSSGTAGGVSVNAGHGGTGGSVGASGDGGVQAQGPALVACPGQTPSGLCDVPNQVCAYLGATCTCLGDDAISGDGGNGSGGDGPSSAGGAEAFDITSEAPGVWSCSSCPGAQPSGATPCGVLPRFCSYGAVSCECRGSGWTCGVGACPSSQPPAASTCTQAQIRCPYGDTVCSCKGSQWSCVAPSCEDPSGDYPLTCSYEGYVCAANAGIGKEPVCTCPVTPPTETDCHFYSRSPCAYDDYSCDCWHNEWTCGYRCPTKRPTNGNTCHDATLQCNYAGSPSFCGCNGSQWVCQGT